MGSFVADVLPLHLTSSASLLILHFPLDPFFFFSFSLLFFPFFFLYLDAHCPTHVCFHSGITDGQTSAHCPIHVCFHSGITDGLDHLDAHCPTHVCFHSSITDGYILADCPTHVYFNSKYYGRAYPNRASHSRKFLR